MKILLVGEYSRLHNSLKEGLVSLGHDVTILGTGDYFKNYPVDIKLSRKYDEGLLKKLKIGIYKITGLDITSISLKKQFFKQSDNLKGFDIVQLINESSFDVSPEVEKQFISFLKTNNDTLFLLSCGTDHLSVKYAFGNNFRYSILNPLFDGTLSENKYSPILKYLKPEYKSLHEFVFKSIDGVIASDIDYHIPLKGHKQYLGLISNPINVDTLKFQSLDTGGRIVIFHGINRSNYYKKGSDYFEAALAIIQKKYPDKVHIEIVEDLPYSQYIETYNKAHIILDQVLGYDQGYNALEAMAKGKVVFTGAEKEFEEYYNLQKPVAINALPDEKQIADELEDLILNPENIIEIGRNARAFIEKEHHYKTIAERYISTWTKSN